MNIDFDPNIDFYKVLGVDPKASAGDIKKAFRKLAKLNHPDSTGGDKKKEVRFKEVNTAYEVLGDARKRAQYDQTRDQVRAGGFRTGPGPGGHPFGGPSGPGANVHDLSDLFAQFFSGAGGPGGGVRIEMDDDAAWQNLGGGRRRSTHRAGARRGPARPPAPEPELESKLRAADGTWLTVKGADIHSDVRLPFQDAILGTVREVTTADGSAKVKIPPGTSSGQRLRLRGKGVIGPTGEAGDHYVTVHVDVPRDLDDADRQRLIDFVSHLGKAHK